MRSPSPISTDTPPHRHTRLMASSSGREGMGRGLKVVFMGCFAKALHTFSMKSSMNFCVKWWQNPAKSGFATEVCEWLSAAQVAGCSP